VGIVSRLILTHVGIKHLRIDLDLKRLVLSRLGVCATTRAGRCTTDTPG
jgi:hypothetical protein